MQLSHYPDSMSSIFYSPDGNTVFFPFLVKILVGSLPPVANLLLSKKLNERLQASVL
jgi:hypothetical protein